MVDNEEGEWRYYNSLRPRRGSMDPYMQDAIFMVSISSYNNSIQNQPYCNVPLTRTPTLLQKRAFTKTAAKYELILPVHEPLVPIEDTPQQSKTSSDCGVAVMYIIKQHFQQLPISRKEGESMMSKMRTHIVTKVLEWAGSRDFYSDQMLKRRRPH